MANSVSSVLVTATPADSTATVTVNGSTPASPVGLSVGANTLTIVVTASDSTTKTYTVTVTRAGVGNAAPTNNTLSNAAIAENNTPGATIGTLTATDPDAGDTHTFTFAGGADDGAFTITGTTLSINGSADFENKASYAIRIRATDGGGLTYEENFTVTITDVTLPQTITFAPLGGKTFGDAPFTVSATGGASGEPVTFSVSGPAKIAGNSPPDTPAHSATP